MLRAIRAGGSGEAIFSPAIARRLLAYFGEAQQSVSAHVFPELTERERGIHGLIAHGDSNAQIAAPLRDVGT